MSSSTTTHPAKDRNANQAAERVIPLTPQGALWSQREYVAAMAMGIGFAAHRASAIDQWFHYALPDDIGCTSVLIGPSGVKQYVDHDFTRGTDWLDLCRTAVVKAAAA